MKQSPFPLLQSIKLATHFINAQRKKRKELNRTIAEYQHFYSQFIKKGSLCFDIGANIGEQTEMFLKCGARVISVEPEKKNYLLIFKINLDKITMYF